MIFSCWCMFSTPSSTIFCKKTTVKTDTMRKLKYEMNFTNPIIVITANATTEAKEQYLNAGFDEFISKPVKREDLYNSVIKYLQK